MEEGLDGREIAEAFPRREVVVEEGLDGREIAEAFPRREVVGHDDLLLVEDQQTAIRSLRQCPNFGE